MQTCLNGQVQSKDHPEPCVSITPLFPEAPADLMHSQAYAGLTFRLSITFPPNYPYVAPTLKFDTPCYHPNVDINHGAICLDILQDKWSAVYSVQTILLSLQSLLGGESSPTVRRMGMSRDG